jgi:phosphate transport system substrate-binding protein
MRRTTWFVTTLGPLAALLAGLQTGTARADVVTVKGSDTMVILGQRWAEEFMKKSPERTVQVTGGGSGTGISALINGSTDICAASRAMKQAEMAKLREAANSPGVELPVARDGLAVYVHNNNPLSEITLPHLKAIFTGKITNWKEVGGPDSRIGIYSRENSSGTYVFFKDAVLNGADFSPRAQTLQGTASVVNAVSKDRLGIGYGGAAYAKGVKLLKVKKDASAPALLPSRETVLSGSYALARPLFFYLRGAPSGDIKAFVDWVLSPAGQDLTTKVGFYPLK